MTRAPRGRAAPAAAGLVLLVLGLLPVWALALETPFRLVDDYGALVALQRPPAGLLREAFSLRENPVRFRPTHDLGQLICWHLLGNAPAAHHAVRLLMKLLAFAAFLGVARREAARAAGRAPAGAAALALAALGVALFFYLPNNPEARLAPQELALTLYLMAALYFVSWRPARVAPLVVDALFFASFTLALWSKEPAFLLAAPVLALAWMPAGDPPRSVTPPARLAALAVWLHAAAKAAVMSAGGGYGRPPLTAAGVRKMAAYLPRQALFTEAVPWLWAVFLGGALLCAWHQLARPAAGRGRAWVPWALLSAAVAQYLLLWEVVLRYAWPVTVLAGLLALVGAGAAMARAAPAAAARWALGVTLLALAVAASTYGPMTAQFAMQHMSGHDERAALLGAEQAARESAAALHVTRTSEYTYRAALYFGGHLPRYEGRSVAVSTVRRADDIAPGGLLLARAEVPEGFDVLARFGPADPPPALRRAEAVSRAARLGRAAPEMPLDAGAPGLPSTPWFLARRR